MKKLIIALLFFFTAINAMHTPDRQLFQAASAGRLQEVKKLVKEGALINYVDKYGNNALMIAIQNNHVAVINYLLDMQAKLEEEAAKPRREKGKEKVPPSTEPSALVRSHIQYAEEFIKSTALDPGTKSLLAISKIEPAIKLADTEGLLFRMQDEFIRIINKLANQLPQKESNSFKKELLKILQNQISKAKGKTKVPDAEPTEAERKDVKEEEEVFLQSKTTKAEVIEDLIKRIKMKLEIIGQTITSKKPKKSKSTDQEWQRTQQLIAQDLIDNLYMFVKEYGFLKNQRIQKIIVGGINGIVNLLPAEQRPSFNRQIQIKITLSQPIPQSNLIKNILFNLLPTWQQVGAECGLRAMNSAALIYYFCTDQLTLDQLKLDLLSKREIAFDKDKLKKARTECGKATFNNLSEEQVEKITKLLTIPEENIIIIGNYGDVKKNLGQMIPRKIKQLADAIKDMQTKPDATYIFLLNTGAYKEEAIAQASEEGSRRRELTSGGHWTAIVLCKKKNQIIGYVADSNSLYIDGKIKESLQEQMEWLAKLMNSDYKKLLIKPYEDLFVINLLIKQGDEEKVEDEKQAKYFAALKELEKMMQYIDQNKLFTHPAFQEILNKENGVLAVLQKIAQSLIGGKMEVDARNATTLLKAIKGLKAIYSNSN